MNIASDADRFATIQRSRSPEPMNKQKQATQAENRADDVTYEVIEIPGGDTMYEDSPIVTILSTPDSGPVVVKRKYASGVIRNAKVTRVGP